MREYPEIHIERTGVPALDRFFKSTRTVNLNNSGYIELSDQALRDAVEYIERNPKRYLANSFNAWRLSLVSPAQYPYLRLNRAKIADLEHWYTRVVEGTPQPASTIQAGEFFLVRRVPAWTQIGWTVTLGYLTTFLAVPVLGWLLVTDRAKHRAAAATVFVASLSTLLVAVAGNAFELGENNRFRFETDAIMWVTVTWVVTAGVRQLRDRSNGSIGHGDAGGS
jgi:MFS family permease